MTEEKSIRELLDERNELHEELTSKVAMKLKNVFSAVSAVNDDEKEEYPIIWTTIDMAEEDTLFIMGLQMFPDPDEPELDEDGLPNMIERVIRIGISIDLAETGSVSEIVTFFNTHTSIEGNAIQDFETDSLTDEQRKQLEMFSHTKKGTKN